MNAITKPESLELLAEAAGDTAAVAGNFELVEPGGAIATVRSAVMRELIEVDVGTAALALLYGGKTFDVSTTKGMEAAVAARLAIRTPRYRIPHIIKERKAELKEAAAALDAEGDRIIVNLLEIENPINDQIEAEKDRKERIKADKAKAKAAQAEEARVLIASIRHRVQMAVGQSPAALLEMIAVTDAIELLNDDLGELAGDALRAKSETLIKLRELHANAVAWEVTQSEIREAKRVAAIKADIEQFGRAALDSIGQSSAVILGTIATIEAVVITADRFFELTADALTARTKAVLQLDALHTAALAAEAAGAVKAEAEAEAGRLEQQRKQQEATQAEQVRVAGVQQSQAESIQNERTAQITAAIEAITSTPARLTSAMPSAALTTAYETLRDTKLQIATFGGRIGAARAAHTQALGKIETMVIEAESREEAEAEAAALAPIAAPSPAAVAIEAPAPAPMPARIPLGAIVQIVATPVNPIAALAGLLGIIRESQGVYGYRDRFGVTEWESFAEVAAAELAMKQAGGPDDGAPF